MNSTTLVNLKQAQTAFKTLRSTTKTAMVDPSMGMGDKDMMIEQIFQKAEELVDTAITAVESAEGGGMGGAPEMGDTGIGAPDAGVSPVSTDIPDVVEDNPDKLNTAMGDHDPTKMAMIKMAQDIENQQEEIDTMKNKEAQMKMAQKYSDAHPLGLRTAKFNEFMNHKGTTPVLEARLDEAMNFLSKENALKFAQQEDSIFKFEDDNDTHLLRPDTGSKI